MLALNFRSDIQFTFSLQILKSYYRCSDALLAEQIINGNWQAQMVCGILLLPGEQIKDKDIAGRWRSYLGQHLDMDKLQMDCVSHWKPYMEHIHTGFSDATVYESYIEYPTDAKLLWKSCCDVLQMIRSARKKVKLRDTRIKQMAA